MTELERLKNHLFGDPERKVTNFNVFWGPEAHRLTPEQRPAEINKVFDSASRPVETIDGETASTPWNASFSTDPPRSKQPQVDLREWLAAREKE